MICLQVLQDGPKHILFVKEVFPEDSGLFTCRATNQAGVAECSAELFVEGEFSNKIISMFNTTQQT